VELKYRARLGRRNVGGRDADDIGMSSKRLRTILFIMFAGRLKEESLQLKSRCIFELEMSFTKINRLVISSVKTAHVKSISLFLRKEKKSKNTAKFYKIDLATKWNCSHINTVVRLVVRHSTCVDELTADLRTECFSTAVEATWKIQIRSNRMYTHLLKSI